MNRLLYLLGKGLGLILRRPVASIGTLLSLFLLCFLFNLVWVASLTISRYYQRQLSNINVEIFLQDTFPDSSVAALQGKLAALDGVDTTIFISRDEARARLYDLMGTDLLQGFDENPLPRSVVVSFKGNFLNLKSIDRFKQEIQNYPGVSQIFYARNWLEKSNSTQSLARKIVIILGAVILLAALLNLVYSVRLAVRTGEIRNRQLALMGAGRYFLTFPYIFGAVIFSLLASIGSWIILNYLINVYSLQSIQIVVPGFCETLYFCLGTGLVGILGGYIGSRRI